MTIILLKDDTHSLDSNDSPVSSGKVYIDMAFVGFFTILPPLDSSQEISSLENASNDQVFEYRQPTRCNHQPLHQLHELMSESSSSKKLLWKLLQCFFFSICHYKPLIRTGPGHK